jgi:hypothetical protein
MRNTNTTNTTFNGYKNYETWNVSLWMMNDEDNYDLVKACSSYDQYMNAKSYESTTTPDGVKWNDSTLDYTALDELVHETN